MAIMGVIYATLILQHFFCTYIEIFYTPTSVYLKKTIFYWEKKEKNKQLWLQSTHCSDLTNSNCSTFTLYNSVSGVKIIPGMGQNL